MAKEATKPAIPSTPKALVKPPEGLRRFTGDVVGFHDLEEQGPIYGIPRGAKLSDSDLDKTKPSVFVIFELLQECEATEGSGDDAVTSVAKKGDMVGVWLKGGMRAIRSLCGLSVFMQHTGEKKLKGKPAAYSAMKTYDFHVSEGKGNLIHIIEDNRKESAHVATILDPKKKPGSREPGEDEEAYGF